jgi:hypothetical protein
MQQHTVERLLPHSFVREVCNALRSLIIQLQKQFPRLRVQCTGHSLGGYLAQVREANSPACPSDAFQMRLPLLPQELLLLLIRIANAHASVFESPGLPRISLEGWNIRDVKVWSWSWTHEGLLRQLSGQRPQQPFLQQARTKTFNSQVNPVNMLRTDLDHSQLFFCPAKLDW